jgi:hypothetical protein
VRRIVGPLLAVILAATLGACGDREDARDEVLEAVRRTERLSYRYAYEEKRPATQFPNPSQASSVTVQGLVEDHFRFKAQVAFNGAAGWEQVVSDDSLAIRFLEPARLSSLVNKEKVATADTKTDLQGASSLQVLQSRRWVLDEAAAPTITIGRSRESELGKDPVLDSITALSYVEEAIRQAQAVVKFNPDSVRPTYSASEDDFPKPEGGSGVTRYDLVRPKLPPPGQQTQGGVASSGTAQTRHFRRMAIYVKDGRIVQVREAINLRGKFLRDFTKYIRTFAKESGASDDVLAGMEETIRTTPEDELGDLLLQGLNAGLAQFGDDPVMRRTMRMQFDDLGAKLSVDLPTGDVVKGGLGFLIVSESGKESEEGETTETNTSTTTTTAAGAGTEPAPDDGTAPPTSTH